MVKKLISAAAGIGLVLAAAAPAFAANLCANQTTGPSSYNICTRTITKPFALTLNRFGSIFHNVTSVATSGNNTANNNTGNSTLGGGMVVAGDATADTLKQASLNTGNITVNQTDPASDEQGLNDTTGPSSNNTVTFTTTKSVTLNHTENGTINQTVNSNANSGGNQANMNTLGGSVVTGNATSTTTIMSILNDLILNVQN